MIRFFLVSVILILGVISFASAQTGNIALGDTLIHYEIRGQGEPLVLIHGWRNDLHIWDAQAVTFSSKFKVVRYDRRGWGQSTGFPDVTSDPADLAALLDTLGIRSANVIGHSQGAQIALAFAQAFPGRVNRLILYGCPPPAGFGLPWNGPDSLPNLWSIARHQGMDSVHAVMGRHPLLWFPTPVSLEAQTYYKGLMAKDSGRDLLEDHAPSGRVLPARMNQLGQLRMPTLILTGDHEIPYFQVTAHALAYGIPGAQKVVISNAGHNAHMAQPAQFNTVVLRFLTEPTTAKH